MTAATLVLVRHGETTWNRDRRVQGWAPSTLTDRGEREARAVGAHLADAHDVDGVVHSDLRRTVETARWIVGAHDRSPRRCPDPAWRERDFGVLQGLTYEELFVGYPEFSLLESGGRAASARPEGGESWLDLRERVLAAWRRLCGAVEPGRTVCVVTHGGPIRAILAAHHGLGPVEAVADLEADNCGVTTFRVDEAIDLCGENETPWTVS